MTTLQQRDVKANKRSDSSADRKSNRDALSLVDANNVLGVTAACRANAGANRSPTAVPIMVGFAEDFPSKRYTWRTSSRINVALHRTEKRDASTDQHRHVSDIVTST